MPFSGGSYTLPPGTTATTLTAISSSRYNAFVNDVEATFQDLWDGTSYWTGPFKAADGSAAAPGITFNSDPNTGFYSIGADNLGIAIGGALEVDINGTRMAPGTNDGLALGDATKSFADLFLASGGVINWANGDVTATHSSNALAFAGASSGYSFAEQIIPNGGIKYQVIAVFTPLHNHPPASNYATLSTRNSEPVLQFDTTTQEGAVFGGIMPYDYAGGSIRVTIWATLASATSGTLGWLLAFEAMSAQDTDSDGFASDQTATAATVPGTSGVPMTHQVTFTQAQADAVAAGEAFRLRVRRDVSNDTAAGDAELIRVLVEMV